jgi:hypothetical protein
MPARGLMDFEAQMHFNQFFVTIIKCLIVSWSKS